MGFVKGNNRSRSQYMPDGIQPIFGNQLACNGDFGESELLVPGEFRLFMHVIGPTEEYDVTCLGHIKWNGGGWAGTEHFQLDNACVIPNGKHGYWLFEYEGIAGPTTPGALPALPSLGYIPANWDGDRLKVRLAQDYHDTAGVTVTFTVLHKMDAHPRILAPGEEIPQPYRCPNGEVIVAGKRMCRPDR